MSDLKCSILNHEFMSRERAGRAKLRRLGSKALFTIVGGTLILNPVYAADANNQELEEVVITGLRGSLQQSMDIKRDASGVVDAISAEDIGKFPDTNLAESMQRITGISIERRNGEGAQVTARGFGPENNMVTLNGRQIPGADGYSNGDTVTGGVGAGSRGFNFAQLASEAISGITVYKTGRASAPTGGIGATLDIHTARPFDHDGLVATAGAKAVMDESQPFGTDITPEVSGIFSYANPEKTWGVGLTGSYQKRKGGDVQATENQWNIFTWNNDANPANINGAFRPDTNIVNAPADGSLFALPNDLRYAFSDFNRERINGQAVVQFAPTDAWQFTLDYTYSTNKLTEDRGEQTQWLNRGGGFTNIQFDTSGAVATPVYLREVTGSKDFGFEQQRNMQEFKLGSAGLNTVWKVNDTLSLTFDGHDSKSRSLPNDPITGASATFFSFAGTNANAAPRNCSGPSCRGNWAQEFTFNDSLPIASRTWYPTEAAALAGTGGLVNPDFPTGQLGSQVRRIWMTKQTTEVRQGKLDGELTFDNGRFQFGLDSSKVIMNRQLSSDSYAALGDWGTSQVGNESGMVALLTPTSITGLFNDFDTAGIPAGAWRGNASELAAWGAQAYGVPLTYNPSLANDNRIVEKTDAAYLQFEMDGEVGGMATNLVLGVRYEETNLVSQSAIAIPQSVVWQDDNDFTLIRSTQVQPFKEKNKYNDVLPSVDFSINLRPELKARASFSQTISRPSYSNLYAGPNPNNPTGSVLVADTNRASGTSQNPALLPLQSDNLDLALEWYFAPSSYVSATFWNKRVDNFTGNTVEQDTMYGLTDPTSGPDAQAAQAFLASAACTTQVTTAGNNPANWCSLNNPALFTTTAMIRNPASGGLAAYTGGDAQWQAIATAYDVAGNASDPLYTYNINRPVNLNKAKIHGWELGGQYFFGETGFGVSANYTIVQGNIGNVDDAAPGINQFALLGLSDTANAVLMYEKYNWTARLAWNWRDKYLIANNQNGSNTNPYYVEAYSQLDASVHYAIGEHWTVGAEAINLTGEDVRWHGRTTEQVVKVLDQNPRYGLSVNYKF
jgi:TonB-dependent receptor